MSDRNLITWSSMLSTYTQHGCGEEALLLFTELQKCCCDLYHNEFILASLVSACTQLRAVVEGAQVHCFVIKTGFDRDVFVGTCLVGFYSKNGRIEAAKMVFDDMPVKSNVTWTAIIVGYSESGRSDVALQLFNRLTESDVVPIDTDISVNNSLIDFYAKCHKVKMNEPIGLETDSFTCTSILTSCGSLRALEQGRQVHSYTIKTNLEMDDFVKNGLIDMYAKCNSLVDAKEVFDIITEHNVISYNAMIEGYASRDMLFEPLGLFQEMRLRSLHPTQLTFVSLLGLSASLSALDLSKQIHGLIVKFGVSLEIYVGSSLVDVYSKCLCTKDARNVFEGMIERDIVVWNAMVSGYTLNRQGEEALKLFLQLKFLGMKPNEFTYVALVTASSDLVSLIHGQQFHSQLIKIGLDLESYVSNSLLDLYAKCGSIKDARKIFDDIPHRDVVCWNSMISRYAEHGYAQEAVDMFDLMRVEGVVPNYVTFVGVLSACSHVGLVESGLNHFESMISMFGIEPGVEHYASIVSLLGRAGKLDKAKEFIEQMPIEPAAIVWRSLLSACRAAGEVDIGKHAAEMAISLDPKDSGSYILLSNILASKGLWNDVEIVRQKMRGNEVLKEPGHSVLYSRDLVETKTKEESVLLLVMWEPHSTQMNSLEAILLMNKGSAVAIWQLLKTDALQNGLLWFLNWEEVRTDTMQSSMRPTFLSDATSWSPPEENWVKCNIDVAIFEEDGMSGMGEVLNYDKVLFKKNTNIAELGVILNEPCESGDIRSLFPEKKDASTTSN
ncbi:hypothetical protein Syun_021407 [Stephania yunnanensis]|uniref:Pentatricopeptide repeat-containing protein n=1 Tax=Stephania yunnanensis TaxID=152371 RepID=A0AAP0NR20_9MAGN